MKYLLLLRMLLLLLLMLLLLLLWQGTSLGARPLVWRQRKSRLRRCRWRWRVLRRGEGRSLLLQLLLLLMLLLLLLLHVLHLGQLRRHLRHLADLRHRRHLGHLGLRLRHVERFTVAWSSCGRSSVVGDVARFDSVRGRNELWGGRVTSASDLGRRTCVGG